MPKPVSRLGDKGVDFYPYRRERNVVVVRLTFVMCTSETMLRTVSCVSP